MASFAWQGEVNVETPNTQLLLTATEGSDLGKLYYGDKSATLQKLRQNEVWVTHLHGNWMVDKQKLPHGISALCGSAAEKDIKFGIWIEQEMTNTVIEL